MAPVITSVTPDSGSRCEPVEVVIAGTGFTDVVNVNIGFYLSGSNFTVDSDTQITATTDGWPFDTPDSVTVQVETLTEVGTLPDGFTFLDDLPQLDNITPTSGPNNTDTLITINGSGFTGVVDVQIGDYSIGFVVNSDIEIAANVPGFIEDDTVYIQVFRNTCYSAPPPDTPTFVFGSGGPVDPPPDDDAGCLILTLPDLVIDGVTADADGIVYTPQALDGWFDSIPMRSGTLEANPRGETITVARENARTVDVVIVAHIAGGQLPLGNVLCFTAIETIKTAFRAVFVPVLMQVADPSGQNRTMLARRVGPIKSQILGNGAAVQFTIPMLGENPVLVVV